MDKTKLSKSYNILIRLGIILLTLYFIYDQVFYRKDLASIIDFIPSISKTSYFYLNLGFAFVLFPVNQFLEAIKWKYLISKLEKCISLDIYQGRTYRYFGQYVYA